MVYDIIGLLCLLLLSAFFSSSELAFVVSNKIKIELRARKNNIAAKNAHYFIDNPHIFFSTILISNNVVNIAFASLSTVFLFNSFGYNDFTILVISTFILLMLGELIPKYFAREMPDRLILFSSIPIRLMTFLLFPVVNVISKISDLLTRPTNLSEENISHLFEKDNIQNLLNESSSVGIINEDESDIINKVIELGDQKVYEAMTPRMDIVGIEITSTIDETIRVFIDSGYSKIPVYKDNLDDIKGFVHAYDMFKNPIELESVLRKVMFIPDTKKTLELLNELLEKRISLAIVIDEFGGTAGIITIEDIIEEMFGEIRDEYDIDEEILKKIDSNTYLISGKIEIDYLNEQFEINIPEGDYETVAGYVTSKIGKIPEQGKYFLIDNFRIHIIRSNKKRIELVKIQVLSNN